MYPSLFKVRAAGLFGLSVLALAFAGSFGSGLVVRASGDLQNPGFENGLTGWTVTAPDAVAAVGAEGPAEWGTYATQNITVQPYLGQKMARLGTPRDVNAAQPTGLNSVSQTFTPATPTLTVAVRLFSWEFRSNDTFSISATNAAGAAAGTFQPFNLGGGVQCSGPSICTKAISTGRSGNFLDTGWQLITITGLPAGQPVTLTVAVAGARNNAHATWAYVDNENTAPVADFECLFPRVSLGESTPPPPSGESCGTVLAEHQDGWLNHAIEGTAIQFADLSADPDPLDSIVAWEWHVTGAALPSQGIRMTNQNPFFVPPGDGTYSITLTVWDSNGSSARATKQLIVLNAPPLVNALDTEVLSGRDFKTIGRFSDAGWPDTHTAGWDGGVSVAGSSLQEDNLPALGTGIVSGVATGVTAGASGSLVVTDSDGGSQSDSFAVTVLPDDAATRQRHEPANDLVETAPLVTTDARHLGFVDSPTDRDVFEIQWKGADGNPVALPAGSEILVSLDDLPEDYDVVLFTVPEEQETAGFAFSGFAFSGFAFSDFPTLVNPYAAGFAFSGNDAAGYAFSAIQRSPYSEAGFAFSGYAFSGYAFSGFAFSGYAFSGFAFSPYDMSGFAFSPISQHGFNGLAQDNVSSGDIALEELGIGSLPPGARVVGYSANRGTDSEALLARVDVPGTRLYAVVVGANGAFSDDPYVLQVEGSMPLLTAAFNSGADLSQGFPEGTTGIVCTTPRTDTPSGAAAYTEIYAPAGTPTALFVTQKERMMALHDMTEAEWASFEADLVTLAAQVNGRIVSADGPYQLWDQRPCNVDRANDVAAHVRGLVQAELAANPSIDYVVLVGDDDIIPSRRIPDETTISNERYYLISSYLRPGTPLWASVAGGFNLTDDCYVDESTTPWLGRELCVPDRVVSRLIETPAEIAAQARAFVASGGLLDESTEQAFVAGYDFFDDGAHALADVLESAYVGAASPVTRLISDTWTAADLRCQLLGSGSGCPEQRYDVSVPYAHFSHYAGLSAFGFNTHDYDDVLASDEVAAAAATGSFIGKLLYTIGCHAGFNVPDRASSPDGTIDFDTATDFAQAFARARAVYVASNGFGLGDDQGIGGTERLLLLFSEELGVPEHGGSVGRALLAAKRRYLSSLGAASVYDEKSSINLTLYGLPMYTRPGAAEIALAPSVSASLLLGAESHSFDILDHVRETVVTASGSYVTLDGDAGSPPYRPLLPRVVRPIPATAEGTARGALIISGTYDDEPGWDPVIVRPRQEWEQQGSVTEPEVCFPGFWPADLLRINTLNGRGGSVEQSLVITPAQFRCDTEGGPVSGTHRTYTSLEWQLLRSDSQDVTPPAVTNVAFTTGATLRIQATDPDVAGRPTSGLARIVVLKLAGGVLSPVGDLAISGAPQSGDFGIPLGPVAEDDRFLVQVVDVAGNVGLYSAKGETIDVSQLPAGCSDPRDVFLGSATTVDEQAADVRGCLVDQHGDSVAITLLTEADIVVGGDREKVGYEVTLSAGSTSVTLMWKDGKFSGLPSLQVDVQGNRMTYRFNLSEAGFPAGETITWFARTQAGIPGTPGAGSLDLVPDSGEFYLIP